MNENPQEQTVKFEEPMKVKATDNLAKDTETKPIDRVDVENKIKGQEKDIAELRKSGQKLQGQLQQLEQAIVAKMGAVAGLKDLLDNGK